MTEKNQREKQYLYWLTRVHGMGAVKIRKLKEYAGSFERIYNMKEREYETLTFLSEADRQSLWKQKEELSARQEEYHKLKENGIQFIAITDENYPKRLTHLYDMPMALFLKGKLPEEDTPSVAIIGARSCSYYGRTEAEYLGRELAKIGIQVVSGLAYGVDGAGHKGVLSTGGAAYAVLGSGIDNCYPRENWNLYNEIQKNGGVISEYGPGTQAETWHFPVRNRIISGLSDAIIVVEARKRSGSLITVGQALEQGKEVFALPGRVTDPLSMGCNELIRAGASPVLSPEDIIEFLGIKCEKGLKLRGKKTNGLAKNEKKVYSCLDLQPRHIEEVVNQSKLSAAECMTVLLKLELDGYVSQTANQYYVRKLE
ncbi:MAG: DNA-processing protein DprA [Clostridium sp.]